MIGAIIGDIVGSPYEFHNIKRTDFPLFQTSSHFTDDTMMTLANAKWLTEDHMHSPAGLVRLMREIGRSDPYIGYGPTFIEWLYVPDELAVPYNSWGNGAGMRVSPVGLFAHSMEECLYLAKISAEVTHNHPEGIKGAQAIASSVFIVRESGDAFSEDTKSRVKTFVEEKFGYDLDFTIDEIRPGYGFDVSCHGSRYILQQVLHRFTEVGCRQAEPGEYTRRAYLNGKMDLSQAEAVADLIASTNKATHKMALSQLKGHFSNELSLLREKLLKMTSLLELELDFSDHEELEFADRSDLQALAEEINHKITTLAHSFETGNALKQGVAVAIVGKTNVGKSTLLNRLLHEEKAIVSDIHGTTRDVIEDTTLIDGITFRFIDTAGIRKTDDVVENIGIERTFQKMEEAKIVIWLLDEQPSVSEIEEMKLKNQGKKLLVVFNKMDKLEDEKLEFDKFTHSCGSDSSEAESPLFISARTGENVSSLEQALVKAADIPEITENDVIITSARHYEALIRAHDSLSRVLESMEMGMSGDIIAEDLKMVLEELGEITGGQISSQETLNNIFKHFCIGK